MITGMFNPFGGIGSSGGGGGKVKNFSNGSFFQEEQLCSFNASECIANTEVPYGQYGSRVITRLQISDEEEIAAWQINTSETEQCIYDREDQLGAYAGYVFTQPKYITRVKIWATIHKWQNKALTFTLQYLTEDDEWVDYCDYVVDPQTPYPSNVFETRLYIGFSIKGIRWCHYKRPEKTTSNNIIFAGMTVYEGIGISTKVYTPISDFNPIPEGYSGFSAILSKGVANLGSKEITANGIYQAMDDSLDGYRQINVNVPPPERYMTIDELDQSGNPTKISFYCQPGDVFSYFDDESSSNTIGAFSKATEINLDENYSAISKKYTFAKRTSLRKINLPSQLTTIPLGCFLDCTALVGPFELTDKITSIGQQAFANCSALQMNADLSNIENILQQSFYNCANLNSVIITDKTTSIGSSAFDGCSNMNGELDLSNVVTLATSAFSGCSNLSGALDLKKISVVNAGIFKNCKKLTSIDLSPNQWNFYSSSATEAFRGCESLTYIAPPSTYPSGVVPASTFRDCKNLTQVFDLSQAKSMESYCFANCEKIEGFIFNQVTSLGNYAFSNCKAITSIEFNNSTVDTFGEGVFKDCISLKSITVPSNTKYLKNYCFENTGLLSIDIPKVTQLESAVFRNCTSLQSINFGSTSKTIGAECFRGCISLEEIDYSNFSNWNHWSTNSGHIYQGCTSLKTVKFPNISGIRIYTYDFADCPNLTTIVCPSSGFGAIGSYAFTNCGLKTFPTEAFLSVTSIPTGAFLGSAIESAIIPNNITSISSNAFQNCDALESITIPDSVTSINSNAFANCGALESIVIPQNATLSNDVFTVDQDKDGVKKVYCKATSTSKLQSQAFRGNTSITDVYFTWSEPTSSTKPRYGLRQEAIIHYDWDPNAED